MTLTRRMSNVQASRSRSQWRFAARTCALATLWLIAMCTATFAVDVRARVDRDKVQIAEPLQLTIDAIVAPDQRVAFPETGATLGPFQIISTREESDVPELKADTVQRRWTRIYELEAYEAGDLRIPPLDIFVGKDVVSTKAISISVTSNVEANADPQTFRDLKDIEAIPVEPPQERWIVWTALTVVTLLAAAALAWRAFRRQKNHTPLSWTLARLDELQASPEFSAGDRATLLPPLADALREYIQRQFDVAATLQTTPEFLHSIQSDARLTSARREELRELLREVDEIKFASLRPEQTQLHETFARARTFVNETSQAAEAS